MEVVGSIIIELVVIFAVKAKAITVAVLKLGMGSYHTITTAIIAIIIAVAIIGIGNLVMKKDHSEVEVIAIDLSNIGNINQISLVNHINSTSFIIAAAIIDNSYC